MTRKRVRRTQHGLRPVPTRTVTTPFLPGQEAMTPGTSRATSVLDRVLGLSEDQVQRTLKSMIASFGSLEDRTALPTSIRGRRATHAEGPPKGAIKYPYPPCDALPPTRRSDPPQMIPTGLRQPARRRPHQDTTVTLSDRREFAPQPDTLEARGGAILDSGHSA